MFQAAALVRLPKAAGTVPASSSLRLSKDAGSSSYKRRLQKLRQTESWRIARSSAV
jgi:hypothetical protein